MSDVKFKVTVKITYYVDLWLIICITGMKGRWCAVFITQWSPLAAAQSRWSHDDSAAVQMSSGGKLSWTRCLVESFTCSALRNDTKLRLNVPGGRGSSVAVVWESPSHPPWGMPAGVPRGFQPPRIVDQIWPWGALGRGFEVCDTESAHVKREGAWQLDKREQLTSQFSFWRGLCAFLCSRSCQMPCSI